MTVLLAVVSRLADTAKGIKVFWFFFSKKNTSSFSEEKEAKRLLFLGLVERD
jgi:hypothetical protein